MNIFVSKFTKIIIFSGTEISTSNPNKTRGGGGDMNIQLGIYIQI